MIVDTGCDWLTATSESDQAAELMYDIWQNMLDSYHIPHRFRTSASWFGYFGTRVEHGFYGTRNDQALIKISGPLAREWAYEYLVVGARPSRLDLQVTGQVQNCSEAIGGLFDAVCDFKPATGRKQRVKLFTNERRRHEGMYIGRRQSEVFLRVYDKYEESKDRAYQSCVRVEVETKSHTARQVSGAWLQFPQVDKFASSFVRGMMESRGMRLPFDMTGEALQVAAPRHKSTVEGKMAWLLQQVSPTVQALIEEVGEARIASLFFPDSLDLHKDDTLDQ